MALGSLLKRLSAMALLSSQQRWLAEAREELVVDEDVEDKLWAEGLTFYPHRVETEDKYVLTVFHVYPSKDEDDTAEMRTKGTILLQHGSSMDGQSWFMTENKSLPGLLVKAGFDVYIGNDRGTRNSLSHRTMRAKKHTEDFYDFSFAELGMYDSPAVLNYIRMHAKSEKIIYVGYQQAATSILYAFSKPYTSLLLKSLLSDVILLAPCVFLSEPILNYPG